MAGRAQKKYRKLLAANGPAAAARRRRARHALFEMLLGMYGSSKLSATDFCVLCHYAACSGVLGARFDRYAVEPGKGSGAYKKHLRTVLPSAGPFYMIDMPAEVRGRAEKKNDATQYLCVLLTMRCPMRLRGIQIRVDCLRRGAMIQIAI